MKCWGCNGEFPEEIMKPINDTYYHLCPECKKKPEWKGTDYTPEECRLMYRMLGIDYDDFEMKPIERCKHPNLIKERYPIMDNFTKKLIENAYYCKEKCPDCDEHFPGYYIGLY